MTSQLAHIGPCRHVAFRRPLEPTMRPFTRRQDFSLQTFAERSLGVFQEEPKIIIRQARSNWPDEPAVMLKDF